MAAWEINQIRECVWNLVCIGDKPDGQGVTPNAPIGVACPYRGCASLRILSKDDGNSGIVMEKKISPEKTKVLKIDWGQTISSEDPAYIVII